MQALVDAGAVVVGKANLHEFAWGVTSQNPWYGTVKNPRPPGADDRRLVGETPPRSPPGSATSASAPTPGCSIRLPSACCGTVGLKTALGRDPDRRGSSRSARRCDTVGPMARTVEDVALMWSVLTGKPRRNRDSPG